MAHNKCKFCGESIKHVKKQKWKKRYIFYGHKDKHTWMTDPAKKKDGSS